MRRIIIVAAAAIVWLALGGWRQSEKGRTVDSRAGAARRYGGEMPIDGSPDPGASHVREATPTEPLSLETYRRRRAVAPRREDDDGEASAPPKGQENLREARQAIAERVRKTVKRRRTAA